MLQIFLCFVWAHITQLLLCAGVYDYDSTAILGSEEPVPLEAADLLPGMSDAPLATSQHYTNGRRCDITEFNQRYHDAGDTETLR